MIETGNAPATGSTAVARNTEVAGKISIASKRNAEASWASIKAWRPK